MHVVNSMQAIHFLRLLSCLKNPTPLQPASEPTSTSRQTRFILRSAYASMAYAAGPRRVWSRALVRRIRRSHRRPTVSICNKRRNLRRGPASVLEGRAEQLRRMIPGGDTIVNGASLLEETDDYIQFLRTQVIVMKALVDSFSKE